MNHDQLIILTTKLLEYNRYALETFQHSRQSRESGDFYKEVKPFANKVKEVCEKWEPLAVQWTIRYKPTHIYPHQIKNTSENLQMVSIRAFYPKTSLRQFNSHIQSIEYVLKQMLEQFFKKHNSPSRKG